MSGLHENAMITEEFGGARCRDRTYDIRLVRASLSLIVNDLRDCEPIVSCEKQQTPVTPQHRNGHTPLAPFLILQGAPPTTAPTSTKLERPPARATASACSAAGAYWLLDTIEWPPEPEHVVPIPQPIRRPTLHLRRMS